MTDAGRIAELEATAAAAHVELARLRAGLERIAAWAHRDPWRPDREWPTDLARRWHDGHTSAAAHVYLLAQEVLDPEGAAHQRWLAQVGSRGTDTDWWRETGHCGGCGRVADCCDCEGACGCWEDHGPPRDPYESPMDRAWRLQREALEVLTRAMTWTNRPDLVLRCDAQQGSLLQGDAPTRCGECPPCHVAVLLRERAAV